MAVSWCCSLYSLLLVLILQKSIAEDPEVKMNVSQIISYWGYPCEEHNVVTSDGYILSVQRIPHGRNGKHKTEMTKPVVYLQHGLIGSSTHFVLNPANSSVGFILADAGYDVWLGNSRGNIYSTKHKTLSPDSDAFWDFSWDDFAKFDIPATLNYILNYTQSSSLSYVGHSQGTTIAFAEFSRNQTLASKVDLFIALAPVAYVGNMISPLRYLSYFTGELEFLFKLLGVRDFNLPPKIQEWLADLTCNPEIGEVFCANVAFLLCGFDKAQLNETRMPVYAAHIPQGTSVKDIVKWAQGVRSKKFCMYDYGTSGNQKHYGQDTPPNYNLSAVKVPTALFYGGNDWLADVKDVNMIIAQLKSIVYKNYIEKWDHLDFIAGKDAPQLVYDEILKLLAKHSGRSYRLRNRIRV